MENSLLGFKRLIKKSHVNLFCSHPFVFPLVKTRIPNKLKY